MPAFLVLELGSSYSLQSDLCTWEGAKTGLAYLINILMSISERGRVALSSDYRPAYSMGGEETPRVQQSWYSIVFEIAVTWAFLRHITLIFFPAWGNLVNGCCLLHSLAFIQPGAATMSARPTYLLLGGQYARWRVSVSALVNKEHREFWKTKKSR